MPAKRFAPPTNRSTARRFARHRDGRRSPDSWTRAAAPRVSRPDASRDGASSSTGIRRRRASRGAVLAASLLVASLTAWWLLSRPAEPRWSSDNKSVEHEPEPAPITPVAPTSPLAPAVAMEWKAFDDRTPERAKLYLAAGDRYAHDHQDLASALRCYEEVLDLGGPYVEVSLDDSWLVMALKLDRQKEK